MSEARLDQLPHLLSVPLLTIENERRAGWPYLHPEDFCHYCGQRNITAWFVDSFRWNAVFGLDESPIVCPQCFAEFYALLDPIATWELRLDEPPASLRDTAREVIDHYDPGNERAALLANRLAACIRDVRGSG